MQIRIINACCVLHNYARHRQHVRDDLLPDDANLIRSVTQSVAWSDFRQQFADEMFANYPVAHEELTME
jgi:hypothetical protein